MPLIKCERQAEKLPELAIGLLKDGGMLLRTRRFASRNALT
jgi:hypothetical protein